MSGTILRDVDGEPRYTTTQAAALLGVTHNAIRLRVRIAAARGCAIGEQARSRGAWQLTQEDLAHLAAWPSRRCVARSQPPALPFSTARPIRRRIEAGEDRDQVAAAYGISLEELAALVDRRSWREVP
jgi:hypothetical protein